MQKPSIPKGTRDFGPDKMIRRNYIFSIITSVFEKYGFQPLETPAMENLSVLTGKYGQEGDQLLYKILNSGDFLKQLREEDVQGDYKSVTPRITEKGLRYDLTVPFARYVVMNQGDINFPFKRYQIQPVWRADRPQKGRYREFYQCDADTVGTDSLLCEAESLCMICDVFDQLGLEHFTININNRKILAGITEMIGEAGKETAMCTAIDKLDKIGEDGVKQELMTNGFSDDSLNQLMPLLHLSGDNRAVLAQLKDKLSRSDLALQGLIEIEEILDYLTHTPQPEAKVHFNVALARGLTYYTGAIFEVKATNSKITSSITGGGRYDNLTGVFGLEGVSGVGFSFGVERIYDVMDELDLFPGEVSGLTKILITNFDKSSSMFAFKLVQQLRDSNIACELYPTDAKIKKQLNYANKKGIPYVMMVGSKEIEEGKYGFKDMRSGEQLSLSIEEIIAQFQQG